MPKTTPSASSATGAAIGTLGAAISAARAAGIAWDSEATATPVPIRHVARRSGVSAGQISRIESGQIQRPRPEILVSIARGLNRNPLPLMVLAGHMDPHESRRRLATLFREGSELADVWEPARIPLEQVRAILADPDAAERDVRVIAADVFSFAETEETLWHASHEVLLARGADSADLRELLDFWNYMGRDRRGRLLAYARELRDLTDLEYRLDTSGDRA